MTEQRHDRMTPRLTLRRLRAIEGALNAMMAGEAYEGDWPDGVTAEDMEAAWRWACEQIDKREQK